MTGFHDQHQKNPLILAVSIFEPRCEKTGLRGLRPGPTNRAVQLQKMARGLKFQI